MFAGLPVATGCGGATGNADAAVLQGKVAGASAPVESPSVGRYQIVSSVPTMMRGVMLLDTKTGRTWILCSTKGDNTSVNMNSAMTDSNWCAMEFYGMTKAPSCPNPGTPPRHDAARQDGRRAGNGGAGGRDCHVTGRGGGKAGEGSGGRPDALEALGHRREGPLAAKRLKPQRLGTDTYQDGSILAPLVAPP